MKGHPENAISSQIVTKARHALRASVWLTKYEEIAKFISRMMREE
jgi:hypothetical protein